MIETKDGEKQEMHISEIIQLPGSFAGGCLLGLIYFGGLWWITQRLATSPHPGSLALSSLTVRMSVLLLGLFAAVQLGAAAVISTGLGLLAARQLMIQHVRAGSARGS